MNNWDVPYAQEKKFCGQVTNGTSSDKEKREIRKKQQFRK